MKREIKWAIIMSVISFVWLIVLGNLEIQKGPDSNQFWMYSGIFYIVQFVLFYFAIAGRRKSQRGLISRRDGFYTGLIVTLFFVLMVPMVILVFYVFINPEFFREMVQVAVSNGETIYEAEERLNLWSYIVNGMLLGAIFGGLSSAFSALLLERKPQKIEE